MIQIDDRNFKKEVLDFNERPVFIEFFGESCGLCKAIKPFVNEISEKYKSSMKFASVNVSKSRKLAISQGVMNLPTFIIYKNGVKSCYLVSYDIKDKETIDKFIKTALI